MILNLFYKPEFPSWTLASEHRWPMARILPSPPPHSNGFSLIFPFNRLSLVVLVDRSSIEVFANEGEVALAVGILPQDDNRSLEIFAAGGSAKIERLLVYALRSIWQRR